MLSSEDVHLGVFSGCTAFDECTIGTKVLAPDAFCYKLVEGICNHDESKDRAPGQHFISLTSKPLNPVTAVSPGVAKRTTNPHDYHSVLHRGRVIQCLKRDASAPVTDVNVVVYTLAAFEADPETTKEELDEVCRYRPVTHVVVAVLAGPSVERSPFRFTAALAGENNEASSWGMAELRSIAKDVVEADRKYCVVADVPAVDAEFRDAEIAFKNAAMDYGDDEALTELLRATTRFRRAYHAARKARVIPKKC